MRYIIPLLFAASPVWAHPPVVEDITHGVGSFSVTLSHDDTGWDHYADGWRVELADGTVLGTRELAHPHVNEQPFTRTGYITVPAEGDVVYIRASCNVTGWADETTAFSDFLP